jgi:hypothetical protein
MLQKGYETEFHVQGRSQTGVWERAERALIHCELCPFLLFLLIDFGCPIHPESENKIFKQL